ncbi:hypothetical protein C8J56DRAFT_1112563 [Mycena floridula]|nr:hypothetical protein C8J56DRAFT_1112563 [Mycena floridula]
MAALYHRTTDTNLQSYLEAYIGVQYNAVIDLSTVDNAIYGPSWLGPPGTTFSPDIQAVAISVLLGGISLPSDGSSMSTSSPSPTSSSSAKTKSLASPIAGGVVKGLVFFSLIGLGLVIWWRK